MTISLSWIKAYVPELEVEPQEYMDAMTLSGSKVEGYKKLDEDLEKIVIGQVLKVEKHPDADKLVICQVDIGGETTQIVTGAPNVFEGAKVPVVLDGGRVAGGHDGKVVEGGIKIKKGKLRGIESNGMMCSIEELGSTTDMYPDAAEDGLYILPEDAPVGESAVAYLGLDDVVVEYEITSNRVDCFSILGIAREAAATFGKEFVPPVVTETGNAEDVNDYIKVSVEDADLCPRYTARVVKNIKLATYASRCIENEILMYLRRNSKTRMEVSIDEPLNVDWDGNELLLSDILGTDEDVISRRMEDEVEITLLAKAINKLSPREQTIIRLRFGLNNAEGKEKTQKEVADLLGISQSYISRLEKRIMKQLKKEIVKYE